MQSLRSASETTDIYGECGGYMVLGDSPDRRRWPDPSHGRSARALTSFATRRLHLGYRTVTATRGPFAGTWAAHEFHYATTMRAEGTPLFAATDAEGAPLPPMG